MGEINFRVSEGERDLISRLADRASILAKKQGVKRFDKTACMMDLTATHANGCPLDFDRLLVADDFNFSHDIAGIQRHLDRSTGQLTDCFLPRFAARQSRAA